MKNKIKFIDYVKVHPDESVIKLPIKDKIKLIDSYLDDSLSQRPKGLSITYDLSHSGRMINHRIYSVKGQQLGIDSLTSPYNKPILLNHDSDKDPIGRFVSGEWQDLSQEVMPFFDSLGVEAFLNLKKAFEDDEPEQIYKYFKAYGLLDNKDWPGLGRMRVKSLITDEEAIKKFVDGRYLTFSAGSTTDRHVCSICSSDWITDGICEHRHGKIYDDDKCVFITGKFEVLEGSVVNTPADSLSQVLHMEVRDNSDSNQLSSFSNNEETIASSTDSSYEFQMIDNAVDGIQIPKDLNPISNKSSEKVLMDALRAESKKGQDVVKAVDEGKKPAVTLSSDAIKVALDFANEIATQKVEEYVELQKVETDQPPSIIGDFDADTESLEKEDAKDSPIKAVEEDDIDWFILDLALTSAMTEEDKALTTEKRNELPESSFCGPDRSFPVPDCAHATAARRLIGRAKLSTSQRERVLACVNKKADTMSCDSDQGQIDLAKKYDELQGKYDDLQGKYDQLKEQTKALEEKLIFVLEHFSTETEKKDEQKLDSLVSWFDSIQSSKSQKENEVSKEIEKIENPCQVTTEDSQVNKTIQLTKFEEQILFRYKELKSSDGDYAAQVYFMNHQKYLPRGFNPENI